MTTLQEILQAEKRSDLKIKIWTVNHPVRMMAHFNQRDLSYDPASNRLFAGAWVPLRGEIRKIAILNQSTYLKPDGRINLAAGTLIEEGGLFGTSSDKAEFVLECFIERKRPYRIGMKKLRDSLIVTRSMFEMFIKTADWRSNDHSKNEAYVRRRFRYWLRRLNPGTVVAPPCTERRGDCPNAPLYRKTRDFFRKNHHRNAWVLVDGKELWPVRMKGVNYKDPGGILIRTAEGIFPYLQTSSLTPSLSGWIKPSDFYFEIPKGFEFAYAGKRERHVYAKLED